MDLDSPTITDIFDAAKPELMALPASSLEHPRISRERALYMTRILRRELEAVIPIAIRRALRGAREAAKG